VTTGSMEVLVGRYVVGPAIARGGQATVYRARHATLPREVALKVFHEHVWADPGFRARFRRECEALAALEHPNIIPVHDAGEARGRGYLAMRLARGGSLADRLAAGPVAPREAVRLLRQIASALDAAHARGRLHRDLKPGNVLLEPDGHAWLADFGVARTLDATPATEEGWLVGTPAYLAPEVIEGHAATPAADRYGLACLAYETLTGAPPFRGERVEAVLYAHVNTAPQRASARRPDLPRSLDAALARGLSKRPAGRPGSASALVEGLAAALDVAPRRHRARRRGRLRGAGPRGALLAGLALLAVAGGGVLWGATRDHSETPTRAPAAHVRQAPPAAPPPPGPDGAPLAGGPASAADLPGLPADTLASAGNAAGARIVAIAPEAGSPEVLLAQVREALESRGFGPLPLVGRDGLLAIVEARSVDLVGRLDGWALLVVGGDGTERAVIVHGPTADVETYVLALAAARPGAVRAP
jgi:tRNA A-37 threonylcarbamoyl transferase component Bud32